MIVDPTTGEIVNDTDVDELAEALLRIQDAAGRMWDVARAIKTKIADMAQHGVTTKTKHLRGQKYVAEVVDGDLQWSQPLLKKAWAEFPQEVRDELLRIGEVAVNMRSYKLWQATSGSPEFEKQKRQLQLAKIGQAPPSVKVKMLEKKA